MEKNIALIRGDGIGPEIVMEAVEVLNRFTATASGIPRWTWAETPSTSGETRCPRRSLTSAWLLTVCC